MSTFKEFSKSTSSSTNANIQARQLSFANISSYESSQTSDTDEYAMQPKRVDPNTQTVHNIVNNIFEQRNGRLEDGSSSYCSSVAQRSEYSYDERIKYWKNALAERRRIAAEIRNQTGKSDSKVLFNRLTTVDERDKCMVQRVLDYAERLNPTKLQQRVAKVQKGYSKATCPGEYDLKETLPKAEQLGIAAIEISGLPAIAKEEILGTVQDTCKEKPYRWLDSELLSQRLEQKFEDIECVVEFYPDIENLQVVGESLDRTRAENTLTTECVSELIIRSISDSTESTQERVTSDFELTQRPEAGIELELSDFCLKINEQIFDLAHKRNAQLVNIREEFVCQPFETASKRLLTLQNLGAQDIHCIWQQEPYYENTPELLQAQDQEFLFLNFGDGNFMLAPDDFREIIILYQPRRVQKVRAKWLLKFNCDCFCVNMNYMTVSLKGHCKPHAEYLARLKNIQKSVELKSNINMVKTITHTMAAITPVLNAPAAALCPYKRTLSELELFELHNPGYKCERHHDLTLLRTIYESVKQPCQPDWDLRLQSLRSVIFEQPSAELRASVFADMLCVLEHMKGTPIDLEQKFENKAEQERSRFVYVRGMLAAGIDEWGDVVYGVEESFLASELKEYEAELELKARENPSEFIGVGWLEEVESNLRSRLYERKVFLDTLYMHTYTHLCNLTENIVSVIEDTEML